MLKTVGERVQDLRAGAGASRETVSRLTGLALSGVGHIERGARRNIESRTLGLLAELFDVDPGYILSGNGERPADDDLAKAIQRAEARARRETKKAAGA